MTEDPPDVRSYESCNSNAVENSCQTDCAMIHTHVMAFYAQVLQTDVHDCELTIHLQNPQIQQNNHPVIHDTLMTDELISDHFAVLLEQHFPLLLPSGNSYKKKHAVIAFNSSYYFTPSIQLPQMMQMLSDKKKPIHHTQIMALTVKLQLMFVRLHSCTFRHE